MPAPTYSILSNAAAAASATSASFTGTAGRLLVARLHAMTDVITARTGSQLSAAGWTAITGTDSALSPGWGYASCLFWKLASGSSESMTGALAGGGTVQYWKHTIIEIAGNDTGTPFRQAAKDSIDQAETTTNFSFALPVLSDSLVLAFYDIASNGGTQTISPGGSGGGTEIAEDGITDWVFFEIQSRVANTGQLMDATISTGMAGGVDCAIEIAAGVAVIPTNVAWLRA